MAYTTGITDSAAALHTILRDFLIAQGWVQERWDGSELIVRGPGGGATPFWVAFTRSGEHLVAYGMTGFVSGNALASQPNLSTGKFMPTKNKPFRYHIVVNDRRVIIAAAGGPWYSTMYAGYILSYASTADYTYPLFIGGRNSAVGYDGTGNDVWWSMNDASHPARQLRIPGGTWIGSSPQCRCEPLSGQQEAPLLGGAIQFDPLILFQATSKAVYGELDGIYSTTRGLNSDRSIVTVSGVDYLVFMESVVGNSEFWGALRLA